MRATPISTRFNDFLLGLIWAALIFGLFLWVTSR